MKPPRYLLREDLVKKIVDKYNSTDRFLEIGFGKGDMLITLAQRGLSGIGFDFSSSAYDKAKKNISDNKINSIQLVRDFPQKQLFNKILFFEVIGYIEEPIDWLKNLQQSLNDDGMLIFSFTNKKYCGDAEQLSGEMVCFDRNEINSMLESAGYSIELCWNYGYPLSNWLRPLLHWYYRSQSKKSLLANEKTQAVQESGLVSHDKWIRLASSVFYPLLIYPFVLIQRLFLNSDLGTGYLVVATKVLAAKNSLDKS